MHAADRAWFEENLEIVLSELPPLVVKLINEIPLVVDDHPSPGICRRAGVEHREELCGLYVGRSLDKKTIEATFEPTEKVYLFREGIFNAAEDDEGVIDDDRLREEIRKTILHEYGHHHGMDEDELEELGY